MQAVIYGLWLGLNLAWQIPGVFILDALLGIYLFFVFPHMVGEQAREDATTIVTAAESGGAAGGGPDSEDLLEAICRHLERMRTALEQVDRTLGMVYVEHQDKLDVVGEAVSYLVQDTQRRARRRAREGAVATHVVPITQQEQRREEENTHGENHEKEA